MAAIDIQGPAPKSVEALQKAIKEVLSSNNDQKTKRAALKMLQEALKSHPISISNSHFRGNY